MKSVIRSYEVESTLKPVKKVAMGIHQDAMAHIMNVLTDLYSDTPLAVFREYSTNAYDAHIEAGNPSPIEVTLPSRLAPFVRIRDFGLGLNLDDIENIYSQYGASTKRDSDDFNGMLGLGCKSALTYTNQFTVVGIKDGIKTIVSVSRSEIGGGDMDVLEQSPTDESSGVEIIVPVNEDDVEQMIETAQNFYRFWKPGTVLVNGEEPEVVDGFWLTDDQFEDGSLLLTEEVDESVVVMGNVAYPMDRYYCKGKYKLVAFVPIGAVNFAPDRETLKDNETTTDTISDIKQDVDRQLQASLQKIVDAAANPYEAMVARLDMYSIDRENAVKLTYQGQEIPRSMQPKKKDSSFVVVASVKKYRQRADDDLKAVDATAFKNAIFFTGYNGPLKMTPGRLAKIYYWAEQKGIDTQMVTRYILTPDAKMTKKEQQWLPTNSVYKWADVEAIKVPREKVETTSGRVSGSYDIYDSVQGQMQYNVLGDDIDTSGLVFYRDPKRDNIGTKPSILEGKKYVVVNLAINRVAKFKREVPKAQTISEYAVEHYQKWANSLDREQRIALRIDAISEKEEYSILDADRIIDSKLAEWVRASQRDDFTKLEAKNDSFQRLANENLFNHSHNHPRQKYPLLTDLGRYGMLYNKSDKEKTTILNHVYLYLNAASAEKESN